MKVKALPPSCHGRTEKGKPGQVSIEFMTIFIMLISALTIVAAIGALNTGQMNYLERHSAAEEVLSMVTDKINVVFIEGDGFSLNMTLPETIAGRAYTLAVKQNSVEMVAGDDYFYNNLLTRNVTGPLSPGTRTLKNVNGVVVIS
jgi:hypothetical protein